MSSLAGSAVTLIGLRKQAAQPLWEPLYGDGGLAPDRRFVVPFGPGAAMEVLPPNHHQVHALEMSDGEPVIHIRHEDGRREVFRAWRVCLKIAGEVRIWERDELVDTLAGAEFMQVRGEVASPDRHVPPWQRMYDDILADIPGRRLLPGDRLPSAVWMPLLYGCKSPTPADKAMRRLREEGWIEGRRGVGSFVAGPHARVMARERSR